MPTVIDLNKLRWWCDNYRHSSMATTPLVAPNHSIAKTVQTAIVQFAHLRLPKKTIATILGVSAATVQRVLDTTIKYHPARTLPTHLCFDEFRSTGNMMSFICIDGETHKLVGLRGDRLNETIKDFFISHDNLKGRSAVQTIAMDTAITMLRQNRGGVLAATASPRSNGPIEGINRLIKSLKRSCFVFSNQANFFNRIYQLVA